MNFEVMFNRVVTIGKHSSRLDSSQQWRNEIGQMDTMTEGRRGTTVEDSEAIWRRFGTKDQQLNHKGWTEKELSYMGFVDKWKPSTMDIGNLRSLEYVTPLIDGRKDFAILCRGEIQPFKYGTPLKLTMRVIGESPTIRAMACMFKNIWNIRSAFQINRFKYSTFTIVPKTADYLRCCDRTWEMICNTPMKISKNSAELEHSVVYNGLPQWAIIGLLLGMFAKEVINWIASVLGMPLHTKYINTRAYPCSI